MDVLSDVLSTVRLESTVYAQTFLSPPWGISADAQDAFAFHVIPRGYGWLEVEGRASYPVGAGDVVLLAPGRAHALRDEPSSPTRPLRDLLAEGAFNAGAGGQVGYESDAAFAKAFKRTLGVSPGAYRRSRTGAQRG